jgi:hypothetical protein
MVLDDIMDGGLARMGLAVGMHRLVLVNNHVN